MKIHCLLAVDTSSIDAPLSDVAQRHHVVEAVSFIIEEHCGISEVTCLYQVHVHGNAAVLE